MLTRRTFKNFIVFILFSLSLALKAAIPNSALVGQTTGSFSVTPSGSASYTIPIQLPPNVGGVQPNLSLSYDSSAGNGLLGVGWQLSGLSSISRCSTTLERDGYIDGVDFDANDQFCLDGQRLVNLSGSAYRTELDDFSTINGGVNGFTVETASGLLMSYGANSNSRIQLKGQSSNVITWALNEVKDPYGNRYTVTYQNNGYESGEYYARRIDMYSSTNNNRHIEFAYQPRTDIILGYQAGSQYKISQRLSAIHTFSKNSITKKYLVKYFDPVAPLNISYVESIEECDSSARCLAPINFEWDGRYADSLQSKSLSVSASWGSAAMTFPGDFNGDGLTDIASVSGGNIYMKLSAGDRFTSENWTVVANWGDASWTWTGDFNGDGFLDIASASGTNVFMKINNKGKGFRSETWTVPALWGTSGYNWAEDFNGDGLTDIASAKDGKIYIKLSTGTRFDARSHDVTAQWGSSPWTWVGDFNGDGLLDVASASGANVYMKLNEGGSFTSEIWTVPALWGTSGYNWAEDFNGDGLTDLASVKDGNIYVKLSTGTQFEAVTYGVTAQWGGSPWTWVGDFNGDGLLDIASASGVSVYMKIHEGNGFRSETWSAPASWGTSGYNWITDTDGDGISEIASANGGYVHIKHPSNVKKHIISSFEALDNSVDITYKPLTSSLVYRKDEQNAFRNNLANYPSSYFSIIQTTAPVNVVSQVDQPDGTGGTTATNYSYEGLRYDAYGKRALGFSKTIIENPKTDIRSTTTYNQEYPYVGMVTSTLTKLMSSEQALSQSSQSGFAYRDTSGKKTYFPYATEQKDITYLLDDNLMQVGTKTVITKSTYNTSGQVTNALIESTGSDGLGTFSVATTNEYTNGYSTRRQGEIIRATVESIEPDGTKLIRKSSFEYDWSKGHLIKEVIEPGHADPSITRVSVYGYDSFGNRTSTVTCDGRFESSCTTSASGARYSSVQFSSDGLFATSAIDALNYTSYSAYDARFGVVTSLTDINGLVSTFTYDSLGRQLTAKNPFNQTTTTTRAWCDYTCPTVGDHQAYYKITTQAPSTPTTVVYFDQFNREIRKQTEGFNAEKILVDTEYDDFGRVKRSSEPYFEGESVYWNTPVYDALGRKSQVTSPNQDGTYDTTSSISYQGFTTVITDALDRKVTEVKNVLGQVVRMTDKKGNNTDYKYDALGNLISTEIAAGRPIELFYDIRGRKIQMNDPDMGTWLYEYNTFDQLVKQTDAKRQITFMVYDVMGRMTSRTDLFGTPSPQTASWSYYTTPLKSRGKLNQKTAANGDFTRYTYNTTYGQLIQTDQKIGTKTFSVKYAYDTLGRVSSITYPSTTAYSTGFKVVQQYNAKGYLNLVRKDDNTKTYWRADAMSPRGQLEAATYGNGTQELSAHSEANGWLIASVVAKGTTDLMDMTYEFDAVGNIKKRIDGRQQDMTEAFEYDELDRLTHSTIYGGPSGVNRIDKTYEYDEVGNIMSKSDIGRYTYTGCGGRPHAVCSAGSTTYTYDANGSMLTSTLGTAVTTIGYTPFNKANFMKKGINYEVTFNYDAERNRNYKSSVQNSSLNLQTYYVGTSDTGSKIFEQEVSSATGTKDIHYIYGAGGQAVATHITQGTAKRTEYLHRDHLGSVALVTNDAGQVVSPASFDAWGKRRNTNWSDNPTGAGLPAIIGNIGFTGQETIAEIDLIHMNGRVYDPNLGRFLSADPLIQAPYNSQSYNRYSYVMNNPLSLVDPTGYSWISKKWKKHGRKVMSVALFGAGGLNKHVRTAMTAGMCTLAPWGCGGVVAANAWISGANTSGALKAGARAQVAAYIGAEISGAVGSTTDPGSLGNIVGNGIAGGVSSEINGGQFRDGFVASAVGATLKPLNFKLFDRADQGLQRVAFASIAGGAASYLSGGKVGAGMVSAAFSQYWNGEMHRDRIKGRQPSLTPAQSAEGFHNAADIVSNSLLVASASPCFLICASLSAVVDWVNTSVYALNGDYWSAGANLIPGFAGDAVKHSGKLSGVVLPKENLMKIGAEVGTDLQMDQDYMRTRYYEESTYSGK